MNKFRTITMYFVLVLVTLVYGSVQFYRRYTVRKAYESNVGTYGRFDGAAKYIDPREE